MIPRLGTKIVGTDGAILIAYTHNTDGGDGFLPNGVGICLLPNNDLHPYVVWSIITQDAGETWFAQSGTYCTRLDEALAAYYVAIATLAHISSTK